MLQMLIMKLTAKLLTNASLSQQITCLWDHMEYPKILYQILNAS